MIANMDNAGLTNACILTFDALEVLPREDCIRVVRQTNDEIAAAVKRHPDRFLGTIALPMPYVDAALETGKNVSASKVEKYLQMLGYRLVIVPKSAKVTVDE